MMKLKEVHRFSLDSGTCWRNSDASDVAIFEAALPQGNKIVRCSRSLKVVGTMNVDVFGFPGALEDQDFGHASAAKKLPVGAKTKCLSHLCQLGSAIECTKRGVPEGYLGGGLDTAKYEQYQAYGYSTFRITVFVPPDTEVETKDEL